MDKIPNFSSLEESIKVIVRNKLYNNQGRFISCQAGGILYSMCFHQTRQHSAICEVHNNFKKMFGAEDKIVRSAKSTAPPGQWAIAYCDSGRFGGDKTDFEIL